MFFLELLLLPILIFILLSVILLPFKFAFFSLLNLIYVPVQLFKIATNKQLRVNHALEHATINVLEKEFGYVGLTGYAKESGFFIQGRVQPIHLEKAALMGLKKLRNGETHLVVHKRCGTSILAANFMAAAIFIVLLWQTGMISFFNIILAVLIAQLSGPMLGRILQESITTSTDVRNIDIVGLDYQADKAFSFLGVAFKTPPAEFFVKTKRASEVEVIKL